VAVGYRGGVIVTVVVALADEFDEEQIAALVAALPDGARVISLPAGDDPSEATAVVNWMNDVDDEVLDRAQNAHVIVTLNSGTGAVTPSHAGRGLALLHVESPALISVAEHAVMLICAVFKRLGIAEQRFRAGVMIDGATPELTTQESYAYNWVGLERFEGLYGQTIGLVGLGKIGSEVATRLRAFECDVAYTKRNRLSEDEEQTLGVRYLPFDELLASSHCVSLHNRFDEATGIMMGAREFGLMRPRSFFVNTARGRLVDEEALVAALESEHLAGAGLDVFQYEPLQTDSPLLHTPNTILTPHSAGIPIGVSLAWELGQAGKKISNALSG